MPNGTIFTVNFPCRYIFNHTQEIMILHLNRGMESFWTWEALDGINIDVLTLVINVFIFWTILILIEMDLVKLLWIKIKEELYGSRVALPTHIDNDVKLEKDTIFNDHINNNVMKVCNLTKKFGRFDAVRGLTFGVRDKVYNVSVKTKSFLRSVLGCLVSMVQEKPQRSAC